MARPKTRISYFRFWLFVSIFAGISITLNFVPHLLNWSGYFTTADGVCFFVLTPATLVLSQYLQLKGVKHASHSRKHEKAKKNRRRYHRRRHKS